MIMAARIAAGWVTAEDIEKMRGRAAAAAEAEPRAAKAAEAAPLTPRLSGHGAGADRRR